jgi:phospholipid/cholesterol/gamma-HCH transport system ATP-binding protein
VTVAAVTARRGGRVVFRDFDLYAPAGTWTALIGATAAGKTTLLRLVSGSTIPPPARS